MHLRTEGSLLSACSSARCLRRSLQASLGGGKPISSARSQCLYVSAGGTIVSLQGMGFPASPFRQPVVAFLGAPFAHCDILAANASHISCVTRLSGPALPEQTSLTLAVSAGSHPAMYGSQQWWLTGEAFVGSRGTTPAPGVSIAASFSFLFSPAATPTLTVVTPAVAAGGRSVTIALTLSAELAMQQETLFQVGLDRTTRSFIIQAAHPTAHPGGPSYESLVSLPTCELLQASASEIVCVLPVNLTAGVYSLLVWHAAAGFAVSTAQVAVQASVTSVEPSEGEALA